MWMGRKSNKWRYSWKPEISDFTEWSFDSFNISNLYFRFTRHAGYVELVVIISKFLFFQKLVHPRNFSYVTFEVYASSFEKSCSIRIWVTIFDRLPFVLRIIMMNSEFIPSGGFGTIWHQPVWFQMLRYSEFFPFFFFRICVNCFNRIKFQCICYFTAKV